MTRFVFILAFLLSVVLLSAQDGVQGRLASIELKDGKKVWGTVQSYSPGDSIVIVNGKGDLVTYHQDEIFQIKQRHNYNLSFGQPFGDRGLQRGIHGAAEFQTVFDESYGISATLGYQFNPSFRVGAGYQYLHLADNLGTWNCHTPFLNGRMFITYNSNITPFVDMRVGYTLNDCYKTYVSPALGARFGNKRFGCNLEFVYEYRKFKDEFFTSTHNYFFVRIGFEM